METVISKVPLSSLGNMRTKFLSALDNQFTYDKCHLYGWADTYLFQVHNEVAGYGSVWGKEKRQDRDSIFEFYLEPAFRRNAHQIFSKFIAASRTEWIECQSNDPFLSEMLFEFAGDINAEAILFEDDFESSIAIEGATLTFSGISESNKLCREYVLEHNNQIVGRGGLMLYYNFPYVDIFYGIDEAHQRKGFGSFFVQELKREAYNLGRVPAARTDVNNTISKKAMMKAGMKPCGWRLGGKIKRRL